MKLESLFRRCLSIEYIHIEGDGSYAYERIGNTLYLYFECSNGKLDWKNNLDFPIKAYKGLFIHRGFLRVFKSIVPYVEGLILDTSLDEIVITGYSHGGALACLFCEYAWFVRSDLRGKIQGYGFGAPRVMWGILGKNRHRWDGFYVIRNINDIVTHLPPALFGYRHVGTLIKIGVRGKYSVIDAHRQENILNELSKLALRESNSIWSDK